MSHISLLFLTYSNIIHISEFEDLFANCNIYIHPKYPDKINEDLKKYIISTLVETKWNDKSIVTATLELLKAAYSNEKNDWFILCSQDMYPLKNYENLNTYLSSQKYSIFDVLDGSINKTSQFWALTRDDVQKILINENKWESVFKSLSRKKAAIDELFFLTLLKQINKSYNYTNSKFCYVKWIENIIAKHPTTFNCLLEGDQKNIEENNSCFIRKTYETFKNKVCLNRELTILLVYGSESIKDYTKFINDFKDNANIFILSLLDNVSNNDLTEVCDQTYYTVWNDVENATNIIKGQFKGDIIVMSEKFDANNLRDLLKDNNITSEFSINFDVDKLAFLKTVPMPLGEDAEALAEDAEPLAEDAEPLAEKRDSEILLKLGDIILITDPTNEILNDNEFFIDYIDSKKMKLINTNTFENVVLSISSDGIIGDGTIKSIIIKSSNPEKGYARQNDLLAGTWVNIYFEGEIPTVITGEITNIEEDMIEITTTDGDTLYINFNYQGIPEDLPNLTFEIRPAIKAITSDELVNEGEEEELGEEDKNLIKEKTQRLFFDINDIEFGDIVNVEEYVNIDKDKYRFNIESQSNDLLEELISNIPNSQRTNKVLNSIHIMITRFIQLREMSSTFDINKNINGIIKKSAQDKPLAEYLSDFKNNLYWIMMVAKNIKKIYPSNQGIKPEYRRYDDYENINENESLLELQSLFKNYRADQSVEGQNKYSNLYYSVDPYLTPFYSINKGEDVFSGSNGIIIEADVNSNINAIVDNLGDLYSTVVAKSEMKNRKFVIQRYNLGQERLQATNLKGSKMVAHRVRLTNNDPISINSIITLPEPTVRFSKINLPGENLLVKANLNLHFLNYWELLKQKTNLTQIVVDGLDNDLEYDDKNFVDNIKQYLLDLSDYEKPKELTNLDIYKIFLRTIIPKIRVLFSLVKKYIKGKLSLVDVVNYLEPFLIYPIDLTYKQYNEINKFIYEKIKEYNKIYKEYSMAFSSIKILNIRSKSVGRNNEYFSNELFTLLDNNSDYLNQEKKLVFEDYGFDDPNKINISGSEFLKKITVSDFGNLYNTAVALSNIQLMYPAELSSIFETDKDKLKIIIEKDETKDKCSTYIISKKYYSKDGLLEDNDKPIYFDKEFDTTNYDLIDEKYKKQREQLSTDEFLVFLTDELINRSKISEIAAEHMAETLINQAKKVREGDYAILVNSIGDEFPDTMEYYVRNNNIWVLSKDIDPNSFIKENDLLCNLDYNCIFDTKQDKCIGSEVTKDNLVNNALKEIINQFDKNYNISKEELNSKIKKQLEYFGKSFDKLQQLKRKQFFKYNNQQYEIGLKIIDEMKDHVVSPYTRLRDLIMGQNDFIKKQTDIIQFVTLYCREGDPNIPNIHDGEMENEWWLYCKETDTKLLPKFHYILANTFITNNIQYDNVLNDLKRKIGKRSDDGDAWVDEHSGEVICYIDLDVSEGYKDGFIDKTRDVLEKDEAEIILEKRQDKKDKRLSVEGELVSNVISVLSSNMGLDIEQSRDFIIKVVTEMMNDIRIIEKEPAYKKREDEAAKKGKKLPSYMTVYGSTLIYLTLGMYLVALQTSIPSIRTRKTAPGCVRSFSGFPFEGEGDDSGLKYMACVALKSRDSSTMPWSTLAKNEEKIETTLKTFIIRYILPNSEVNQRFKQKVEYLLLNPEEQIPKEYDLNKWTNFLPPLRKFHVKNLDNITSAFTEELQSELYSGNHKQLEKLLVIESKIISYSLAIQELIQKIVDKKELLMKSSGHPFYNNACCNEEGAINMTALQYFISEDNNIANYNNIVSSLTSLVRDIKILTQSAIMLSEVNTKRLSPEITNEISEETIFFAFIYLCKFQNSIPLSEDLAAICIDKPDYLKKMDTIQEKIAKLKRDGRNYSKDQFLRLFQIVSRNNIIKMSLSSSNKTCINNFSEILNNLDLENNETVPKVLTQKLERIIESYDIPLSEDTKDMRSIKDYLGSSNSKMKKELIDFLRTKAKISGTELVNINNFINDLTLWRSDKNKRNEDIKISDDSLYNYVNFFKNFIKLFSDVFPTMILNQKVQTIEPPKYWGISKNHANDVREMVHNYYKPIEKFYGNNSIDNVLKEIKNKSRAVYLLSVFTPVLTNIKMGEKETYSVFDKRIVTQLFEYYILSVLTDYINLTMDPSMVTRMFKEKESDLFSGDFLIEQELRFSESEQEFIEGDVVKLKQDVAKLLLSYLNIMMLSKKTINVSFEDIQDKVFKLKEAEKYTFTDRLRDMTEEERAVDTILKHNKLGSLYSIGLSKGIKEYDPENFEHDKKVAEKVAEIENRLRGNNDGDLEDALEEINVDHEIEMDLAIDMNKTDDYDDGDPWGEELGGEIDYD
uniref:Uncharacterized protein n=1 Tax=viral metagenome TaxID=1070528 RepID=A0A6C0KP82_9ZZZZ